MSKMEPLRMGVAGLGGYAKGTADTLLSGGSDGTLPTQLVAVGDPAASQPEHAERVAELKAAGVSVYPSFDEVLADKRVEAVWLPVPIPLHRPFTEQALATGKAVMCEKPAAGTVDEVDAMIAARDRSGLPVLIGYGAIYDPATAELKRRLLDGAIGKIRRASVWGCWPRGSQYFSRAGWAGKLKQGDQWVLDSPLQNAMAHYVNLPLFLLGSTFQESATPTSIEAELYRAAPIENYDTISARVQLEDGPSLLVLLTHAVAEVRQPVIRFEGESGTLTWHANRGATIQTAAGQTHHPIRQDVRTCAAQTFAHLVRGEPTEPSAVATLETSRMHTVVVNGASQAAPVVPVPDEAIEPTAFRGDENIVQAVAGIETAFEQCAAQWQMLSEARAFDFLRPPGTLDLRGYRHFTGPHPETAPPTSIHTGC